MGASPALQKAASASPGVNKHFLFELTNHQQALFAIRAGESWAALATSISGGSTEAINNARGGTWKPDLIKV